MICPTVRRYVDAYADGELDPAAQLELDTHLLRCAACRTHVELARMTRQAVARALGTHGAPAVLVERVERSVRAARRQRAVAARHLVPVVAAAGAVACLAMLGPFEPRVTKGGSGVAGTRQAGVLPVLEDVVRLHSSELPPDVRAAEPKDVVSYFRSRVDFPVLPAVFEGESARLEGARLSNVRDARAAALYYDVRGRRLTVVVFAAPVHLGTQRRIELMGQPIFYARVGGYTVPVRKTDGLTYAFTGDFDAPSMLRLAARARVGL
ncbi:MAG: zf-HC2 domain-containing protein [Myxococcota bacterium]|nr:zf-HC2 domain-containing protein [Myxococcota bacterium]